MESLIGFYIQLEWTIHILRSLDLKLLSYRQII